MAVCPIRVPATAEPVLVQVPGKARPEPGPLPVATIAHAAPGEIRLTCTCRTLRKDVEVDDAEYRLFLLAEHLRRAHPGSDHLLIDDERTGVWSSVTPDAAPAVALVIADPARTAATR